MLTFEFTGVSGEMTVGEVLTSGMVGRQVRINLSDEWKNLTRTAVFIAGNVCRAVQLKDTVIEIPSEVLEHPFQRLRVGVRGIDANGTLVIPTILVDGPFILRGADPEEDTGVDQSILTGGTATAADIAEGMTAYVNGRKVTGTLEELDALKLEDADAGFYFDMSSDDGVTDKGVYLETSVGEVCSRAIIGSDTILMLRSPAANFGTATAEDVREGVSFTSAAGLCLKGKLVPGETVTPGETLTPAETLTLENADAGFYLDNIGSGGTADKGVYLRFTMGEDDEKVLLAPGTVLTLRSPAANFGTATAADVLEGVSFTSAAGLSLKGKLVPGETLTPAETLTLENADAGFYLDNIGSGGAADKGVYLKLTIGADSEKIVLAPGTVLTLRSPAANFGTATSADVAAGKTFTSASGLLLKGTMEV